MIVIVESETANLMSVRVACERLGLDPVLSRDPAVIAKASHVLLPGVGHARSGMRALSHLRPCLEDLQRPLLGICLGMQLLYEQSEEGETQGFGLLPGKVRAIQAFPHISLPHMGWNELILSADHPLFSGLPLRTHMYFVHSYQAPMDASVLAHVEHGASIPAVVGKGLHLGVQFHPEKSGAAGQRLLRNFFAL